MIQQSGGFLSSLFPPLAKQENLMKSVPKTINDSLIEELENKGPPKFKQIFKSFL